MLYSYYNRSPDNREGVSGPDACRESEGIPSGKKTAFIPSGIDANIREASGPENVANGVLYLASDEAACVTGAELVIDCGHLVM